MKPPLAYLINSAINFNILLVHFQKSLGIQNKRHKFITSHISCSHYFHVSD